MSCSEIDEDSIPYDLPPLPPFNPLKLWNGREVQLLDIPHIKISGIPPADSNNAFYQRSFVDITDDDEEILLPDPEWVLEQAMEYVEENEEEDLTVDEILALRGLMFDTELGRELICKNVFKRIEHGLRKVKHEIGKGVRKSAQKTKKVAKKSYKVVAHVVKGTGKAVGRATCKSIPKWPKR
jgi:hypothetical protein